MTNSQHMMHINLRMFIPESDDRYIHACARIRRVSVTRLIERMVKTICADQLVLAILDDESQRSSYLVGEDQRSMYRRKWEYEQT